MFNILFYKIFKKMDVIDTEEMFYVNVPVDLPKDMIKHIIGVNARNFKLLSKEYEVKSMWYNNRKKVFTVWGYPDKLSNAYSKLDEMVRELKNNHPNRKYNNDGFVRKPDKCLNLSLDSWVSRGNVKLLIGKNGYNFKNITRESGLSFMWYNDNNHSIQMWGFDDEHVKATQMINDVLNTIEMKPTYQHREHKKIKTI